MYKISDSSGRADLIGAIVIGLVGLVCALVGRWYFEVPRWATLCILWVVVCTPLGVLTGRFRFVIAAMLVGTLLTLLSMAACVALGLNIQE